MVNDFFLTTWFLEGMKWIYQNVGSVFYTILICTLILRVLTVFSDIKTRKSSADMARIQPDIQRIQKKYASDPQRAQVEQRKLMKKEGVSMFGSCLPLLITMPLFFCFIAAFRFWGYEEVIKLLVSDNPTELFATYKFMWINNIWQPDNGMMPVIQEASAFLSTKGLENLLYLQNNPEIWEKLVSIGIAAETVTTTAGEAVGATYKFLTTDAAIAAYNTAVQPLIDMYAGYNNGWFVLPVVAGGLNLISSLMMMKNQPAQEGQAGSTGKMMMYMMPVMSFVICLTANSAFSIYWAISSLLMIVVNFILNKKYPRPGSTGVVEVKK